MLTIEEKNKKLVEENAQLLERWMNKMNEEAEKMNEATQFYETYEYITWLKFFFMI